MLSFPHPRLLNMDTDPGSCERCAFVNVNIDDTVSREMETLLLRVLQCPAYRPPASIDTITRPRPRPGAYSEITLVCNHKDRVRWVDTEAAGIFVSTPAHTETVRGQRGVVRVKQTLLISCQVAAIGSVYLLRATVSTERETHVRR